MTLVSKVVKGDSKIIIRDTLCRSAKSGGDKKFGNFSTLRKILFKVTNQKKFKLISTYFRPFFP